MTSEANEVTVYFIEQPSTNVMQCITLLDSARSVLLCIYPISSNYKPKLEIMLPCCSFRDFHLRLKRDTTTFSADAQLQDSDGRLVDLDVSHIYEGQVVGRLSHK